MAAETAPAETTTERRSWEARVDLSTTYLDIPGTAPVGSFYFRVDAERRGADLRLSVSAPRFRPRSRDQAPGPAVTEALARNSLEYRLEPGRISGGAQALREGGAAPVAWLGDLLSAAAQRPSESETLEAGEERVEVRRVSADRTALRRGLPAVLESQTLKAPLRGTVDWDAGALPQRVRAQLRLDAAPHRGVLRALAAVYSMERAPEVLHLRFWLRALDTVEPPAPPRAGLADVLAPFRDPACMLPVRRGLLRSLRDYAAGVPLPETQALPVRTLTASCQGQIEALLATERGPASGLLSAGVRAPSESLRGSLAFAPLLMMAAAESRMALEAGGQPLDRCVDLVRLLDLLARGSAGRSIDFPIVLAAVVPVCVDAVGAAPVSAFVKARQRLEMARDWRRDFSTGRRGLAVSDPRGMVGRAADLLIRLMDAVEAGHAEEAARVSTWVPWQLPAGEQKKARELVLQRGAGGYSRLEVTPPPQMPALPATRPVKTAPHPMQKTADALAAAGFQRRGPAWLRGDFAVELDVDERRGGRRLRLVTKLRHVLARSLIAFLPEASQRALDGLRAGFGLAPDPAWAPLLTARGAGWPVVLAPRIVDGKPQGHLANGVHIHIDLPPAQAPDEALGRADALIAEGLAEALSSAEADFQLGAIRFGDDPVHEPRTRYDINDPTRLPPVSGFPGSPSPKAAKAPPSARVQPSVAAAAKSPPTPRPLPSAEVDEGDFGLEAAQPLASSWGQNMKTRSAATVDGKRLARGWLWSGVEVIDLPAGELRLRIPVERNDDSRALHFLGQQGLYAVHFDRAQAIDLETGGVIAVPRPGLLSSSGRWSATGTANGTRVVDAQTGRATVVREAGELYAVGRGGRVLLLDGLKMSAYVEGHRAWSEASPATSRRQAEGQQSNGPMTHQLRGAFSPSGARAAYLAGGDAWFVDLDAPKPKARKLASEVSGLRFASEQVLLLDLPRRVEVAFLDIDARLSLPNTSLDQVIVSPDGLTAWAGRVYDLPTLRWAPFLGDGLPPSAVMGALREDGGVLLVAGGSARVWDEETGALRHSHEAPGRVEAVSPGATKLLLRPHERGALARVMDVESGALGEEIPHSGRGRLGRVAEDGTVVMGVGSQLLVWRGGKAQLHEGVVQSLALSGDGRLVAVAAGSRVLLLRSADGAPVGETRGALGLSALDISHDGGAVAFAGRGGTTLWKVAEDDRTALDPAQGLGFSAGSLCLAVGAQMHRVDLATLATTKVPRLGIRMVAGREGRWASFGTTGVRVERHGAPRLDIPAPTGW